MQRLSFISNCFLGRKLHERGEGDPQLAQRLYSTESLQAAAGANPKCATNRQSEGEEEKREEKKPEEEKEGERARDDKGGGGGQVRTGRERERRKDHTYIRMPCSAGFPLMLFDLFSSDDNSQ